MPMIGGTAYGVVLNDGAELAALAPAFAAPPHRSPPDAPVLYIKPRNTLVASGAGVALPPDLPRVSVAATLALAISNLGRPSAARLALDVSEPHSTYFRPAIRERCRDNFLPLGALGPLPAGTEEIVTLINGAEAHRWSLDRLQRPIDALLAAIGGFMSLLPGDLLLIGLPGDAPLAGVGDRVEVRCEGYPPLMVTLTEEAA